MQHILICFISLILKNNKEHFVYIQDFNKLMGSTGKHRTYFCKRSVQPFSSEEKLKSHMNRGCYNVVGTIRVLPKQKETWNQYEDDERCIKKNYVHMYGMRILNVCVKEHKHEDEDDNNNASNTASSSNETPPHLRKKKETTRKIESNHEPNSYSINIEVGEEYIDIVDKK